MPVSFYQEGNTARRHDTLHRIEQKILSAIQDATPGSGATDYATGGNFSGAGPPEGVQLASPGATYVDTSTGNFWTKKTGSGTTTGWNQQTG